MFIFQQLLIPSADSIGQVDEHFIDRYSSILTYFGDDGDRPSSWKARMVGWYIFLLEHWPLIHFLVWVLGLCIWGLIVAI